MLFVQFLFSILQCISFVFRMHKACFVTAFLILSGKLLNLKLKCTSQEHIGLFLYTKHYFWKFYWYILIRFCFAVFWFACKNILNNDIFIYCRRNRISTTYLHVLTSSWNRVYDVWNFFVEGLSLKESFSKTY